MENLCKWTGTTDASITNRLQKMEERVSRVEAMVEEIDLPVKQKAKSNKFLTQNIQEIWDTIKRPILKRIGIEEGEVQFKGTENSFNKIIEENFPNLKKDIHMKVQEAYRTPNTLNQKKITI